MRKVIEMMKLIIKTIVKNEKVKEKSEGQEEGGKLITENSGVNAEL